MTLKTEGELRGLVAVIQDALANNALNALESIATPSIELNIELQVLSIVAKVMKDEDNAVHAAQLGWHTLLLKLLLHDNELISDAASEVVVTCATHNCNTSGINISFPYTTLPLEPPTRPWPQLQALPRDSRDADVPVVLIRAVKRRMTGQPKTGYLLWGAAVILARWIHLHRELFDGKSVLEVGSGLGLSGIVAGAYSRRTILTDYQQDTLKALAYNVMLNQTMGTTVEHLDWDHLDKVPCYVELWKSRWSISNRLSGG
ncbi:hypothetical protein DYB37_009518 [Aphanomyces astaci]|uniref:FAM86 N-terminal domain-containing protein n=1 Tax=Aphanomyces astaci TaxID=112090 RepID=A0A418DM42_APHAT|nr:hypothetical protein DYB35_005831 [Aphanomyces astaci]RHZ08837.1 hypothetical protein DYB37_009518 [Aphanomyces astaci]